MGGIRISGSGKISDEFLMAKAGQVRQMCGCASSEENITGS
jgi:hypothetical protein